MEKIKQFTESNFGKDFLTVLIVILVGLASFGLGRLSKSEESSGLKIEYIDGMTASAILAQNPSLDTIKAKTTQSASGKAFFASSRGAKYYSFGCSAGKSIKQENRVYFTTSEEAEKAGYTLSTSCK